MEGGDHMRIEAYTQVQQMYSSKKTANVKSKSNVGVPRLERESSS